MSDQYWLSHVNTQVEYLQRQVRLALIILSELKPGSVCVNTKCARAVVPHVAEPGCPVDWHNPERLKG